MTRPSLVAFLEAASADPGLQEQLCSAPDAASLAAIAQAAGYAVAEADWLEASEAAPEEQAQESWRALAADPWQETPAAPSAPRSGEAPSEPESEAASEPLLAFLHQAQGDPALREALALAPDAAAVVALARQAGYPISSADLWAASEAVPEELQAPPALGADAGDAMPAEAIPAEEVLQGFLRALADDGELQQAVAEAADAAALAVLAQAAGHPLQEVDFWLLSDLHPQQLQPPPPARPAPELVLQALIHQAQGDQRLQEQLAAAADVATLVEIAQAAGYSLVAADFWQGSGVHPGELQL